MSDFLPPVVAKFAADISSYLEGLAEMDAATKAFTSGVDGHLRNATASFAQEGEAAGQAFTDGIDAHLGSATSSFSRDGVAAGEAFSDGVPEGAKDAAENLVRDINGRLRDSRGRFVAEGESAGKGIGEGAAGGLRGAWSSISNVIGDITGKIGSAFSSIGSVLSVGWTSTLVTGVVAAVGALSQLAPVVSAAGAALASLPAAATAAAGALVTLGLGFHGLGGAISAVFKPAMGGASQSISNVAQQERALEQAQRNSIRTQQQLIQARQAAAQNIKDLALAMSGAQLNVEQAQLDAADAQKAYNDAVKTGDPDAIYRADLALRESLQSVAEAQNQATKTAAQKADADKAGVEGSQQVQSALDAQQNALDAVANAQDALAQSQRKSAGAASALSTAMAGLAPAARAVVMEIQKLKPELTSIQQAVQQHMFAGLAGDLDHLAHAILPAARTGLVGIADQFNTMFRGIAQGLSSAGTINALSGLFAGFTRVLGMFAGQAGNVVRAFGQIVSAATPFLTALGTGAANGLKNLLDWINRISSNGSLQQFFTDALPVLSAVGTLLKNVGSILSSVFSAMGSAGGQALGVIGQLVGQLAAFFKSAGGMQVLNGLFKMLGEIANAVGGALGQLLPTIGTLLSTLMTALQPIIGLLTGQFLPIIVQLAQSLGAALVPVIQALAPALDEVLKALMPVLSALGGALGQVLIALAPVIAQLATTIGQILAQALIALMPVFARLLPVIVQLVEALLPPLIPLIKLVGQVFTDLMPALVPLINLLVDILVPILKLLTPILNALTPIITALTTAISAILVPIAAFIGWLAKLLDSSKTWKAVGKFFTDIWHDITQAFTDGWHWITNKWDAIVDYAKGIPKRIKDAVGDLGSLLVNAGKNVVIGLWNGIVGMGKWLRDHLVGWAKAVIPGPIADALGISSPSKVAAQLAAWVPAGIAKGMDDNMSQVVAASRRLAAAMLPTAGTVGSVGLAGLVPGSAGAPLMPPISVGAGQPSRIIVENHVHTHTYLDGREIHAGLIGPAQRYKERTGTTGLT